MRRYLSALLVLLLAAACAAAPPHPRISVANLKAADELECVGKCLEFGDETCESCVDRCVEPAPSASLATTGRGPDSIDFR